MRIFEGNFAFGCALTVTLMMSMRPTQTAPSLESRSAKWQTCTRTYAAGELFPSPGFNVDASLDPAAGAARLPGLSCQDFTCAWGQSNYRRSRCHQAPSTCPSSLKLWQWPILMENFFLINCWRASAGAVSFTSLIPNLCFINTRVEGKNVPVILPGIGISYV